MGRSTTPTRLRLKGDTTRAQQLSGYARKLLGGLEARKKRFGYEGSMSRKVSLPDGSVVKVTSMRGRTANIEITSPGGKGAYDICTDEEVIEIYSEFSPWWAPPARSQWTLYERFWLLVATGLDGRPEGPDYRGDYSGVIFAKHWQEDKTWGLCDPMGGTVGDPRPPSWHKSEMIAIIEYERALDPNGIWGGPQP